VVGQLGVGLLNVVLLAPTWMQMVHLLVADAVWIAYVLMGALALADAEPAPGSGLQASGIAGR
jgi:heme A synthase